jgi:hypothetical protein
MELKERQMPIKEKTYSTIVVSIGIGTFLIVLLL